MKSAFISFSLFRYNACESDGKRKRHAHTLLHILFLHRQTDRDTHNIDSFVFQMQMSFSRLSVCVHWKLIPIHLTSVAQVIINNACHFSFPSQFICHMVDRNTGMEFEWEMSISLSVSFSRTNRANFATKMN